NGDSYVKAVENSLKRKNEPLVYTREEIRRIIDSSINIRQKALLSVAYACGLRLREIPLLKITDADAAKRVLIINGEGSRRTVMLPEKVIRIIDEYKRIYRPGIWLFESWRGQKYSVRSAESCFSRALRRSGISKRGSFRNLRHSFACHMIEAGTDIYLLQRIMGNHTIKPTRNFLRMTGVDISRVKSPIDDI
ncbi:MAG: tyrosine-type recombinase/integrase, partial [Bacteroidetes bacterium]|nr:tyrosine-type recombinase/integrase [Bacteroidota bacterium]